MKFICSKTGKLFTCFVISFFIYLFIVGAYNFSTQKVLKENEENKSKSLLTFIDRNNDSLYN